MQEIATGTQCTIACCGRRVVVGRPGPAAANSEEAEAKWLQLEAETE